MMRRPPRSTLFPYPPLFRSVVRSGAVPPSGAGPVGNGASALPLALGAGRRQKLRPRPLLLGLPTLWINRRARRSEEHTSELQSQSNLVCRLLLEKKNTQSRQQCEVREDFRPLPPLSTSRLAAPARVQP